MDERELTFLPFPHVYWGQRRDGALHPWPTPCTRCDRQCEEDQSPGVQLCTYGLNYVQVEPGLLIAGVILRDYERTNPSRDRLVRKAGLSSTPQKDLTAVLRRAHDAKEAFEDEIDAEKKAILTEYRSSEEYKAEIISLLQPSLQQTFAQVHDYRQLTSLIIQNVNVVLEQQSPGMEFDQQIDQAGSSIQAIYWAARLMENKLLSALFLVHPERIHDVNARRPIRFHGAVKKYVKILEPQIRAKRITLRTQGESFGHLVLHPDAVTLIPHALLDNAIKYAPTKSEVTMIFSEDESAIRFAVRSLGPKITKNDQSQIFDLFYRGEAAQDSGVECTGFGLGLADFVAREIGATLSCEQAKQESQSGLFLTTFEAVFPRNKMNEDSTPLYRARERSRGGPRTF